MSSPAIDVLIPVYNCAITLRSAVESILTQSFGDFQIFLLEDGSTDESPSICRELSTQDSRVTYVENSKNAGIVERLNQGIALSSAPYIARMDGDDISFPERFKLQTDFLSTNPDVVACSGSYECIDEQSEVFDVHIAHNRPAKLDAIPAQPHFLLHPLLMVRRSVLIEIGGYRKITHCEDADLYFRLAEIGRLHNLSEIIGQYRIHSSSVSVVSHQNRIIQCFNSQLSPLFAKMRRTDSSSQFMTEEASQSIDLFVANCNPSFESLITYVGELLNFNKANKKWLTQAFIVKNLQEARFRKWPIDARNFKFIEKSVFLVFWIPNKANVSFIHHVNLSYQNRLAKTSLILKAIFMVDRARSIITRLKLDINKRT